MGRVIIASIDEATPRPFPEFVGVMGRGTIQTRGVIEGADRPLFLRIHELPTNAEIRWDRPPVDHLVYVWSGEIDANEKRLSVDGVVVVEHNGSATIRAGPQGATLAHFHRREELRHTRRGVALEELFRAHAVRQSDQRAGASLEMRQHPFADLLVIPRKISLGNRRAAGLLPERLVGF